MKIAYNYFILVGPKDDPAGIKGLNATQALKAIMEKGKSDPKNVKFVSRGDNSGTHAREQLLWKKAGYNYTQINNSGPWYIDAGQGIGVARPWMLPLITAAGGTLSGLIVFYFVNHISQLPVVERTDADQLISLLALDDVTRIQCTTKAG
jgi:hypothetical protein